MGDERAAEIWALREEARSVILDIVHGNRVTGG
jgi:hypothetical protein